MTACAVAGVSKRSRAGADSLACRCGLSRVGRADFEGAVDGDAGRERVARSADVHEVRSEERCRCDAAQFVEEGEAAAQQQAG